MNGRFDDGQIHPLTITPHIFQNNRESVENHFARSPLIFVDRLLNCQVHVEQSRTSSRENWRGSGGGHYAGFKGMRMSELGQKSKPGERGEAVEPGYNKTLYNEVVGITNFF